MGFQRTYATPQPAKETKPAPAVPTVAAVRPALLSQPASLRSLAAPPGTTGDNRRAGALLQAQKRYGNRAVQQYVIQRKCACGNKDEEEELRRAGLRRKAAGPVGSAAEAIQEIAQRRGGGQPLEPGTRALMENRFGQDFSGVRVHTDGQANRLARDLNAHAFTHGSNIYFAPGQYAPGATAGRKLLAHELAHVVQQGRAPGLQRMALGQPGDPFEREADAAAEAIKQSKPVSVSLAAPVMMAASNGTGPIPLTGIGREGIVFIVSGEEIQVNFDSEDPELQVTFRRGTPRNAILRKLRTATDIVTDDKQLAVEILKDMERRGIVSPAPQELRLSFARLQRGTYGDPVTFLKQRLITGTTAMAAVDAPVSEETRHLLVNIGVTPEGVQRQSLSPYALVFFEATPGQFFGRRNPPANRWEYVFQGTGSADVRTLGIVRVGGEAEGADNGAIIEVIEVNPTLEGTANDLIALMRAAGWKISSNIRAGGAASQPPRGGQPAPSRRRKKKAIRKNPTLFEVELPNRDFRVGEEVRVNIPHQYATSLPGLRLQNITLTIGADLEPGAGRITAVPTIPFLRQANPLTLAVDETGLVQVDFQAPIRMGALGETDLHIQLRSGRISARAALIPRPAFLRNARAEVVYEEGQLSGGLTFTPEGLRLPVPGLTVENIQGGLAFNNQGVTGSGGATLKYQGLGEATVTVGYQNRQFNVSGALTVNIPGMQPVSGEVNYRQDQLVAQVRLTREHFPRALPLQSGSITIRLINGQVEGSGNVGVRLGPVGSGNLTFAYQNGAVDMGAGINLAVPGLRGGVITLNYREGQLEGEGELPLDSQRLPGLNGNVRVHYREGRFGGETQLGFRRGDLAGSVIIRIEQLEDGRLAASGGGEVSARIAPWLTGRVQVEITRQAEVNVQGEIRAPNEITLFPRREIRRERTFPRIDIPLWGFSIPAVGTVGIVAFIEAGAGFVIFAGPGVLRNIGVVGSFSTQEGQSPSFDISGEFFLPAGAEAYMFIGGGIALGAAIADISGSIRLRGGLMAQASLSVIPHIGFANGDYYFRGEASLQALAYLRFSGAARAAVSVFLLGEVWSKEWPLFDWIYPLGLNVALRGRVDYTFGRTFDPHFELQAEELDPMQVARSAIPGPDQAPRSGPGAAPQPQARLTSEPVPGARAASPGARPATTSAGAGAGRPAAAASIPAARIPAPPVPTRRAPAGPTRAPAAQPGGPTGQPTAAGAAARPGAPAGPAAAGSAPRPSPAGPLTGRPAGPTPAPAARAPAQRPAPAAAPAAATLTAPAAGQPISLALDMAGEAHTLFIILGPPVALEMMSGRRELLSNKIGRAVGALHAQLRQAGHEGDREREGVLNAQIAWLTDIGRRARDVQREAARMGASPRGPLAGPAGTASLPGLAELAEQIRAYAQTYQARDIEALLSGPAPAPRGDDQQFQELLRAASHMPCSRYSGGKHCRGRTNEERRQNSRNGGPGQYFATLTDANITRLEQEALRQGRRVRRGEGAYHVFYRFAQPVGYADGQETNWIRAELSGRTVHSHPRPSGE